MAPESAADETRWVEIAVMLADPLTNEMDACKLRPWMHAGTWITTLPFENVVDEQSMNLCASVDQREHDRDQGIPKD